MNEIKPLPCPFCGSPGVVEKAPEGMRYPFPLVGCSNKECKLGTVAFDSIEEWNRRALCRQGVPVSEIETLQAELVANAARFDDDAKQFRGANPHRTRLFSRAEWTRDFADKLHALLERHKQQEGK